MAAAFRVPISRNYFLIIGVIAAQGIRILSMYIPFMQGVLGISPVTFGEWLTFLAIALALIGVMEVYKFAGRFRNNETSGVSLTGM